MPLFCRYIAYETELEQLRQLRKQSRGIVGKKTLADYALVRRCHFIFERASRKFPGDRRLWMRWLAFCRDSDTPRQTSRVRPCLPARVLCIKQPHHVIRLLLLLPVLDMVRVHGDAARHRGASVAILVWSVIKLRSKHMFLLTAQHLPF